MKTLSGLSSIMDAYDALLLDVWGVVHDGSHLYPGVHDVLVKLQAANKRIIFISNAPRRADRVTKVLNGLGIEPMLYEAAVSSGEVGYQWLAAQKNFGRRYYYIGPAKDADVLDGLDYKREDDVKEAKFLLNVGFGTDEQSPQDWMPLLRAARAQGLPMVCLNPDLEVVKQTGERFACAGVLAEEYVRMKGQVEWFGKPYPKIYEHCMKLLAIPKQKILAVGDGLGTDIKGAVDFRLDAVLVTEGILGNRSQNDIELMCEERGIKPVYVMPRLAW